MSANVSMNANNNNNNNNNTNDNNTRVTFNVKQWEAIKKISDFLIEKDKNFYLFGYAGTGKTFLISNIVNKLIIQNKIEKIFICAPTHQALNVIESYFKSNIKFEEINSIQKKVSFITIYKLLDFKPIIANETGEKKFKSTTKNPELLKNDEEDDLSSATFLHTSHNKLVIIDECSMIPNDMAEQLDKYANKYPIKIIYLGDQSQLPPVGEHESSIFTSIPKNYKYLVVLDEIMRTKTEDIKTVSTIIRKWDGKESLAKKILPVHTNSTDKKFRLYHKKEPMISTTWFKHYIKQINEDHAPIILTWRNQTCNNYNNIIRKHIHQTENITNYLPNDNVIFTKYYFDEVKKTSFYTSDRIKIISILTEQTKLLNWKENVIMHVDSSICHDYNRLVNKLSRMNCEFKVDTLKVTRIQSEMTDILNKKYSIKTINRESLDEYRKLLRTTQEHIEYFYSKHKSEKYTTKLWEIYHKKLLDPYAEINFGYSLTTHKAQGSTYGYVFVDMQDLCLNPDQNEMQKSIYTAATRASNELAFIL